MQKTAAEMMRPYADLPLNCLRRMHRSGCLDAGQSLRMLLLGNESHVRRLELSGVSPHERHELARKGKADLMFIYCSDARMVGLDSEQEAPVSIHFRVAGNAVPSIYASVNDVRAIVSRLKDDGEIVILSHVSCGAVNAYAAWDKSSPTESRTIDRLLKSIEGDTPEANAIGQAARARLLLPLLDVGARRISVLHYDWNTEEGVSLLGDAMPSPAVELLKNRLTVRHMLANGSEGILRGALAKQAPHSIIVAANDLPFSIPAIVGAEQNEVFVVTGSRHGLDDVGIASVFYAVRHLGQRSIVFIAPLRGQAHSDVAELFDKWERGLEREHVLLKMMREGELTISYFGYGLETGMLADLSPAGRKRQSL